MPLLEIKGLGKTYGTGPTAVHAVGNVTFSIDEGEFVCVVGPSGCGKTTLLKCIAGLLRPVGRRGRPARRPGDRAHRSGWRSSSRSTAAR